MNFQHKFLPEYDVKTDTYTEHIHYDSTLKPDSLTKFIRYQLDIKGHLPPWDFRQNKSGLVQFKIQRPGRTFVVNLTPGSDRVEVKEIYHSTGKVLRAMHFGSSKNMLNDSVLDSWSFHAQIATILAFIAVSSSFFFWFLKSVRNRIQWVTIVVSGMLTVFLILYIWLVG